MTPETIPQQMKQLRSNPADAEVLPKSTVLGNKGMEQMLWDAACSIRGEKDAPKFKDYILSTAFIKRLSDVFDDEIQRLSETYGDRKTASKSWRTTTRLSVSTFRPKPAGRW